MSQSSTLEKPSVVRVETALQGPLPYKPLKWTFPAVALMLLITVVAYLPVLFDWFVGDDFVHLIWLKEAMQEPEMIWRNFHNNWLDVKTTKFYRPLISIFMVLDYSAWGANGLGFHLTNLAFLLFSCVAIFFITKELLRSVPESKANTSAFIASVMFGLYPLHCEPVSWITGRVDSIVTAFFLGSMWCYMRWRATNRASFGIFSWISMILALTSKEMAIMIPPTLSVYEFCLGQNRQVNPLLKSIRDAIKFSAPFWITLAGYFVVRRIALGTFVGGYDDSLFFIPEPKQFALNWLHSLSLLFAPANRLLMSNNNLLLIGWRVAFVIVAAAGIWNFATVRELRKQYVFLAIWFALSLAPVYKLFSVSDDLQGSRLAYLCTAALCCLIGLSFAKLELRTPKFRVQTALLCVAYVLFPLCAFGILSRNNSAWAAAGATNNKIRESLQNFYANEKGDPQVLLVGLPDNIHGSYVVRNALEGMTRSPQLSRDIHNCLAVNTTENIVPFGYFKNSIASAKDAHILFWDKQTSKLQPVVFSPTTQLPTVSQTRNLELRGADLSRAVGVMNDSCTATLDESGALKIEPKTLQSKRPEELVVRIPALNCFSTDFIVVSAAAENKPEPSNARLFYENKVVPLFDHEHQAQAALNNTGATENIVFALRGQPDWALGGETAALKLRFEPGTRLRIHQIASRPAPELMPIVSTPATDFLGTKGYVHLGLDKPRVALNYDASGVHGARSVQLEITRANQFFEEQNCTQPSRIAKFEIPVKALKGSLDIAKDLFPQQALFEIRLWALDSNGKRIGVAGDHLTVSVDS